VRDRLGKGLHIASGKMSGGGASNAHYGKYCFGMERPCIYWGQLDPSGATIVPISVDAENPYDDIDEDWFSDERVYECNCIRARNYRAPGPSVRVLNASFVAELEMLANDLERYETSSGMGVSEIMAPNGGLRGFIGHVENLIRMQKAKCNRNNGVEYMQEYLNEKMQVLGYKENMLEIKKQKKEQRSVKAWQKMQVLLPDTAAAEKIPSGYLVAVKDAKMRKYWTVLAMEDDKLEKEANELRSVKKITEKEIVELAAARSNPYFVELSVFDSL